MYCFSVFEFLIDIFFKLGFNINILFVVWYIVGNLLIVFIFSNFMFIGGIYNVLI